MSAGFSFFSTPHPLLPPLATLKIPQPHPPPSDLDMGEEDLPGLEEANRMVQGIVSALLEDAPAASGGISMAASLTSHASSPTSPPSSSSPPSAGGINSKEAAGGRLDGDGDGQRAAAAAVGGRGGELIGGWGSGVEGGERGRALSLPPGDAWLPIPGCGRGGGGWGSSSSSSSSGLGAAFAGETHVAGLQVGSFPSRTIVPLFLLIHSPVGTITGRRKQFDVAYTAARSH
jgi:hypothetical protein